jgi:hypothetical protein
MLVLGTAAAAQPLLPGQAVVTCFSDNAASNSGPVVGIFDIRRPLGHNAPIGQNWQATFPPVAHWSRGQLGNNEVFGIALDDAPKPNIYVTSTAIYNSTFVGVFQNVPGTGQIWRINGTTGATSLCATLPQSSAGGQGLGNIAYDSKNKQFFATDFHDGRIHRIHPSGASCQIIDSYDPFQPFGSYANTTGGFAPLGERLWGVGVFEGRLYFAKWSGDLSGGSANTVWSVPLDLYGKPGGAPLLEVTTPGTMPVADIEFAADGRMLLAQRSMKTTVNGEPYTWAHQSDLLEYQGASGVWVPSSNVFHLGEPAALPRSSAGGADYQCPVPAEAGPPQLPAEPGYVVATGDALSFPYNGTPTNTLPRIYGLQITPPTGGNKANSYLVDFDNNTGVNDKTQIGDVDVHRTCDRQCGEILVERVICETDAQGHPTGKYKLLFRVKNLFGQPVYHSFLVGLPSGVTANPSYFPVSAGNDGDLDPGEVSQLLTTTISGATAGQILSFQVTLHNQDLVQCCAMNVTVPLPLCDCAQVLSEIRPSCTFHPFGWTYTFSLQSLFQQATPAFVLIVPQTPATATITPSVIPFNTNPKTISLHIGNASAGQQVCFLISLHTADFERCCSIRQCVTLPKWFIDFPFDPLPIDGSLLVHDGDNLVVSNPSGEPGVALPLTGQIGADLFWEPIDPAFLGPGDALVQTLIGRSTGNDVDGPLGETRAVKTADGAELRASFPELGVTRHRWELFRAGERVLTVPGVSSDEPAFMCNGCGVPELTTDAHHALDLSGDTPASEPRIVLVHTLRNARNIRIGLAGLSAVADEVRVFPEDAINDVISLSKLTMTASGIPSFTLTGFRGASDCNHNGLDDYDEITLGGGLDLDRDGVLDECQTPPPSPAIDLSTGFDQDAEVPIPGGTADDEWRLVLPAPERAAAVITSPNPAWPAPLGSSRWIGADPFVGRSTVADNIYLYDRTFCLPANAHDVALTLELLADDRAKVFLNDKLLAGLGGTFNGPPLVVQRTGAVGDGLFLAGDNVLRIEVRDPTRVATGFTLSGSVTGAGAGCSP